MKPVSGGIWRGALLFLGALSFKVSAQQAAVYLDATSQDLAGQQLVYQVREALRKSAGLKLVDLPGDAFWNVHLVTIDPYANQPGSGRSTVYSVAITMRALSGSGEYYSTNFVGTCGAAAPICAQNIVAAVDAQAVEFRKALLGTLPRKH